MPQTEQPVMPGRQNFTDTAYRTFKLWFCEVWKLGLKRRQTGMKAESLFEPVFEYLPIQPGKSLD